MLKVKMNKDLERAFKVTRIWDISSQVALWALCGFSLVICILGFLDFWGSNRGEIVIAIPREYIAVILGLCGLFIVLRIIFRCRLNVLMKLQEQEDKKAIAEFFEKRRKGKLDIERDKKIKEFVERVGGERVEQVERSERGERSESDDAPLN